MQPRESTLTSLRIAAAREVFALFDAEGKGRVTVECLPLMVRGLNCFPTEAQLAEALMGVDAVPEGADFADFLLLLEKHFPACANEEAALIKAFRVLDKSSEGSLLTEEIIYNLLSFGDKLQSEQATELAGIIEQVAEGEKTFDYTKLAKHLIRSNNVHRSLK